MSYALIVSADPPSALCELAHDIRKLLEVYRGSIIEIGQKLIAAKSHLKHGEWRPWLEAEFGWVSDRTARNYMAVASAFKSESLSDLTGVTITTEALYALASPKVPEDVREQAIKTARAGANVTRTVALRLIEAAAPVPVEIADTEVVGVVNDADADTFDKTADDDLDVASGRPVCQNDDCWQENMRYWIHDRRDHRISLQELIERFIDTIPLHDATRRWYFDFEELHDSSSVMRRRALLVSLRSLGVKFNPPLTGGQSLNALPGTEFTVPPRRKRWGR
jgi:hypothetical protein